jgi:hypothetical protein
MFGPLPYAGLALKDTLTIAIAGAALVVSIVSFWLSRRYTRQTFESTQYPELTLRTLDLSWQGQELYLQFTIENHSNVRAVESNLSFILTQGLQRIRWSDRRMVHVPGPFESLDATGCTDLSAAVTQLCPAVVDVDDASGSPPRFGLIVIHAWKAPMRNSKTITRRYWSRLHFNPDPNFTDFWGRRWWLEPEKVWAWRPRTIPRAF